VLVITLVDGSFGAAANHPDRIAFSVRHVVREGSRLPRLPLPADAPTWFPPGHFAAVPIDGPPRMQRRRHNGGLDLPSMTNDDFLRLLKPFFDDTTLHRGLDYARRGLAHVSDSPGKDGATLLAATCEGTGPEPYAQKAELVISAGRVAKVLDTHCTCPMATDCKHVVAAIVKWLDEQQEHPTLTEPQDLAPPTAVLPGRTYMQPASAWPTAQPFLANALARAAAKPERERPSLGEALETWLRETEARSASAPASATTGEMVLYWLDAKAARLNIMRARRRKDGTLGRAAPVDIRSHFFEEGRAPRYATPDDVEIIGLVRRVETDGFYSGEGHRWVIDGVLGHAILERIVRTGRCHVFETEQVVNAADSREGRFAWTTLATNSVELRIETDRGAVVALPTTPLMYFDTAASELGDLVLPGPPDLLARLLALPPVAPEAQAHFFAHWRRLQSRPDQPLALPDPPAQVAAEPPPRPQVVLKLRTADFDVFVQSRTRRESRPVAMAVARYPGGCEFPIVEEPPFVSAIEVDGEKHVVTRHVEAELRAVAKLAEIGLARHAPWGYGMRRRDGEEEYWSIGDGSMERWRVAMPSVLARADAAGIALEFAPDFPFRIEEPEAWDEAFDDGERAGWFSLEIGITVAGKRVPIAASLAAWLGRHHDPVGFLNTPGEGRFILLEMPEGGLVKLPVERVRSLLAPLLEFGIPEVGRDGRFRVSKLDAMLHSGLDGRVKSLGPELEALRARLDAANAQHELDPAEGFGTTLRPYQRSGLAWLQFLRECGFGGVLADDMGLGKTVQALAHLQLEKQSGRAKLPNLVVTPTSVLPNWRAEAHRFAPDLRVLVLQGKDRAASFGDIPKADLILTTYALLPRDGALLAKQKWHAVIFDEAQFLKNPASRGRDLAGRLDATHRIALTGTPVENNLRELWSLFDLSMPGLLGPHDRFVRYFRTPIEREADGERLAILKRRVRPFLVRRRREEVLGELPPRTEITQTVELDGAQRDLYESLRIVFDKQLRAAIAERGLAQSQIMILDALLKLRQTCCDPRLVKAPHAKKAHGESAKLSMLKEMIEELVSEGRRALVFSQFASMIALIEDELVGMNVRYEKIIGDTPIEERETAVTRFQAGEASIFLISLRAGGTGLNLTAADTVIHYDPWWNPAVEAQATARAHRIGQDKNVFVYKLIAAQTVEERILELLERKQSLADSILSAGESKGALITEEDIEALLAPMG